MDQDKDQPFVQNVFDVYCRTLIKSALSYFSTKTYVVGIQKKHVLWVLKRTVSMRRFF